MTETIILSLSTTFDKFRACVFSRLFIILYKLCHPLKYTSLERRTHLKDKSSILTVFIYKVNVLPSYIADAEC